MAGLITGAKGSQEDTLIVHSEHLERSLISSQATVVKRTASYTGNVISKKLTNKVMKETTKTAGKKLAQEAAKETSKAAAKETAKQSSKVIATETSKAVVSATATTGSSVAGAAGGAVIGTTVAPIIGTGIGLAVGKVVGQSVGNATDYTVSKLDAGITQRDALLKNFMLTSLTEERDQATDSIGKRIQTVLFQELKKIGSTMRFQAVATMSSIKLILPAAVPLLVIAAMLFFFLLATVVIASVSLNLFAGGYSADNYYCQYEEPWSIYPYGAETIKSSGCGPTTFAMIVSTMTDTQMNPAEAAAFFEESGYCLVSKNGNTATTWSAFSSGVEAYGLSSTGCGKDLVQALEIIPNGGMVVCSVGNSANGGKGNALFNGAGHFIAIRGVTEDGKLLILDPASRKHTEQEWDIQTVDEILKQCWQVYPAS